jgi:hypothetical protein
VNEGFLPKNTALCANHFSIEAKSGRIYITAVGAFLGFSWEAVGATGISSYWSIRSKLESALVAASHKVYIMQASMQGYWRWGGEPNAAPPRTVIILSFP